MFSSNLRYKLIDSSINNPSEHFSILAKLFEHSEFFVSVEKCRRLAIGCRICGNEQSYGNKKKKHSNMKKYLLIKISKK